MHSRLVLACAAVVCLAAASALAKSAAGGGGGSGGGGRRLSPAHIQTLELGLKRRLSKIGQAASRLSAAVAKLPGGSGLGRGAQIVDEALTQHLAESVAKATGVDMKTTLEVVTNFKESKDGRKVTAGISTAIVAVSKVAAVAVATAVAGLNWLLGGWLGRAYFYFKLLVPVLF